MIQSALEFMRVSLIQIHCWSAQDLEAGPEGGLDLTTGSVSPANRIVSMKRNWTVDVEPGIVIT